MRGGICKYHFKSIEIWTIRNVKIRRKSLKRGMEGHTFHIRIIFILFHSMPLKNKHLFLEKYTGLNFPAGCSNSLHQCHASAARRPTVHKMHIDLPFIHCHAQLLCKIIAAGWFRNPNFNFIGKAEIFRRV